MKGNTLVIGGIIVVVALLGVFLFLGRRKDEASGTDVNVGTPDVSILPSYGNNNTVLPFGEWYKKRVEQNWAFNTKLV